jgi:hypothetical protein
MRPILAALATLVVIMLPRVDLPEVNQCRWMVLSESAASCQPSQEDR